MGNDFATKALSGAVPIAFKMFLPFWWLIALVIAVKLGPTIWKMYQRRQLASLGIDKIDTLDGRDFEHYLAGLFRRKGYHVEVTPYVADWGGDLVLSKDGVRTAVQAKRWKSKVGNKAVQEVHAAKATYRCDHAMVVTNSYFTEPARKQAADCKVELWDRDRLVREIVALSRADSSSASTVPLSVPVEIAVPVPPVNRPVAPVVLAALPGETSPVLPQPETTDDAPALCAACGRRLTPKAEAYCQSNLARFGGRLLCYEHQQGSRKVNVAQGSAL